MNSFRLCYLGMGVTSAVILPVLSSQLWARHRLRGYIGGVLSMTSAPGCRSCAGCRLLGPALVAQPDSLLPLSADLSTSAKAIVSPVASCDLRKVVT